MNFQWELGLIIWVDLAQSLLFIVLVELWLLTFSQALLWHLVRQVFLFLAQQLQINGHMFCLLLTTSSLPHLMFALPPMVVKNAKLWTHYILTLEIWRFVLAKTVTRAWLVHCNSTTIQLPIMKSNTITNSLDAHPTEVRLALTALSQQGLACPTAHL